MDHQTYIFIAAFGALGRASCGHGIPPLIERLKHLFTQKQSLHGHTVHCEHECFHSPSKGWLPYLTSDGREPIRGDKKDFYVGRDPGDNLMRGTPEVWQTLREKVKQGYYLVVIGASSGCIGATQCAMLYPHSVLSVTLMSCVPGREQWDSYKTIQCPVLLTIGKHEDFFGGDSTLWDFAQKYDVNVMTFKRFYQSGTRIVDRKEEAVYSSHLAERDAGIIDSMAGFVTEASASHFKWLMSRVKFESDSDSDDLSGGSTTGSERLASESERLAHKLSKVHLSSPHRQHQHPPPGKRR